MPNDSFVDRWIQYASQRTEAPDNFHRYMAYAAVSVVAGKRAWFPWPTGKLFTNLYMLFLAQSASYKSTAINMMRTVINEVDENIEVPSDFTSASLCNLIEKYKEGLISIDEFTTILKAEEGHFGNIKSIINTLYDSQRKQRLPYRMQDDEGDKRYVEHPVFSVVAATTPDSFVKSASAEDLKGGLLSRFYPINGHDTDRIISTPPGMDMARIRGFSTALKRLRDPNFWDPERPMELDDRAYQLRHDWYVQLKYRMRDNPEYNELSNGVNRMRNYGLKFAMLESIVQGHDHVITYEDMRVGIAIADRGLESLIQSMRDLEVTSSNDKWMRNLARAREYCRQHPTDVTRTDLYRYLKHVSKKEMDSIVTTMKDAKDIEVEVGPNGTSKYKWART